MSSAKIGFIFARGGSKGVKKKNIRPLAGKPLIAHSIEVGLACSSIDRIIVSTEDEEIAEIAKQFGAEVPFMRPDELAQDDSPELLAWQHAIREMKRIEPDTELDVFVSVPATAPLRGPEDIDACVDLFHTSPETDLVITMTQAERSPYFNQVVVDDQGYVDVVIKPDKVISRRQDAPVVYDVATVAYVADPTFILRTTSLQEARRRAVMVPKERALDIDTEVDFEFAEYMLKRRNSQHR